MPTEKNNKRKVGENSQRRGGDEKGLHSRKAASKQLERKERVAKYSRKKKKHLEQKKPSRLSRESPRKRGVAPSQPRQREDRSKKMPADRGTLIDKTLERTATRTASAEENRPVA